MMSVQDTLNAGRALLIGKDLSELIPLSNELYFALWELEVPMCFQNEHIAQGYWLKQTLDNLEQRTVQRVTQLLVGEPT